jgi:thiamine-phosphate pyrophosphorylase
LERDIALLVENDIERARSIDADGLHISPDAALYGKSRDELGQRAIIGVGCIDSRHDAMAMAERGADYVAFGGDDAAKRAETVAWWSDIFVVPCVAWGVETPEEAGQFATLGADFVALPPAILEAEGAATRIAAIDRALRRARSAA